MYDVYQHKSQTNRRLVVIQGRPIPRLQRTEQWELIGWTADVSPEAVAAVEADGFYQYEYDGAQRSPRSP
jgi:hypothetical protein